MTGRTDLGTKTAKEPASVNMFGLNMIAQCALHVGQVRTGQTAKIRTIHMLVDFHFQCLNAVFRQSQSLKMICITVYHRFNAHNI